MKNIYIIYLLFIIIFILFGCQIEYITLSNGCLAEVIKRDGAHIYFRHSIKCKNENHSIFFLMKI